MAEREPASDAAERETERATDPSVVSGSSSVDLSKAVPPRPVEKPDLLAEAEQLTISPDEFDDIWQTGVRARAALGLKLDDPPSTKPAPEPESFEVAGETGDSNPKNWEAQGENSKSFDDTKRPTDPVNDDSWKVLGRETEEEPAFGIKADAAVEDLAGPTQPSRRAPTEVMKPVGPLGALRRAMANFLRALAKILEP